MPEFKINSARNAGEKPNPHGGTLVKWYCEMQDADGVTYEDVYWQRKPGNEPKPGDSVYGTVSNGDYGLRFKMEQRPDGAPAPQQRPAAAQSSTPAPGAADDPYAKRPTPPEDAARMSRSKALEVAVALAKEYSATPKAEVVINVATKFESYILNGAQS